MRTEGRNPTPSGRDLTRRLPGQSATARLLLLAAVLFNAVLALVNANGITLQPGAVIAAEAALTAAAAVVGLEGRRPGQRRWIVLAGLIALTGLANALGSGSFDPKLLRDVLIIPVFVLLGLCCSRADIMRVIVPLQAVVLAVMILEAVAPELYGRALNVMSYYINTRGFQQTAFWNTGSDLFVSATRPGDRFLFNGLGIHRLSSVFLEPVSLGNYCVLVALATTALWTTLGLGRRAFLCGSEALILIGCDGRFATVTIAALIAVRAVAPLLPRYLNLLYLPAILSLAALACAAFAISPLGDDFPSRTAGSILALSRMGPADLLGYSTPWAYTVMDSGVAYLLYSQSLIGAAVIWGFIALGIAPRDRASTVMAHGASLYVAMNLMVSYSVFSIKTAALLWFCYGAMGNRGPAAAPAPAARRGALGWQFAEQRP